MNEMDKRVIEDQIRGLAANNLDRIIEIRRELHRHPELGFQEYRTADAVRAELDKLGIPHHTICETGVVGILEGKHPGRVVMLRADMDALPVEETCDLPFKSENPGVMHACAHDGHTAGLLGTAMVLSELREHIHGTVKLLFQPSEEDYDAAIKVCNAGVLKNPDVDYALGLHLWGPVKEGMVAVRHGAIMAAPGVFKFRVKGKGGHGALPQMTIDPVAITCSAVNSIPVTLQRRLSPFDNYVVSFCSIHAGSAYNIIPEYVDVIGTFRTFDARMTKEVPALMEQVLKGIVESQGGTYEFSVSSNIPALVNDDFVTDQVRNAAEKMIGKERVFELPNPAMGGEDFSIYAERVPSSFFFVGISPDPENPTVHHNGSFAWDDSVLRVCAEVMSMAAIELLNSVS